MTKLAHDIENNDNKAIEVDREVQEEKENELRYIKAVLDSEKEDKDKQFKKFLDKQSEVESQLGEIHKLNTNCEELKLHYNYKMDEIENERKLEKEDYQRNLVIGNQSIDAYLKDNYIKDSLLKKMGYEVNDLKCELKLVKQSLDLEKRTNEHLLMENNSRLDSIAKKEEIFDERILEEGDRINIMNDEVQKIKQENFQLKKVNSDKNQEYRDLYEQKCEEVQGQTQKLKNFRIEQMEQKKINRDKDGELKISNQNIGRLDKDLAELQQKFGVIELENQDLKEKEKENIEKQKRREGSLGGRVAAQERVVKKIKVNDKKKNKTKGRPKKAVGGKVELRKDEKPEVQVTDDRNSDDLLSLDMDFGAVLSNFNNKNNLKKGNTNGNNKPRILLCCKCAYNIKQQENPVICQNCEGIFIIFNHI